MGPPGTGKTTIAETLSRVVAEDEVWIPYAVEIDGEIITVFDPSVHVRMQNWNPRFGTNAGFSASRPSILVGGELTAEMLDLQFNPITKFYVAPAQMKANNGVLIMDDFGRQRIRPEELLNRWVVPLDRRIDFMTLAGGKKIEVPFEMLVVFASTWTLPNWWTPASCEEFKPRSRSARFQTGSSAKSSAGLPTNIRVRFDASIPLDLIDFIHALSESGIAFLLPAGYCEPGLWAARYEGKTPYLIAPS